MKSEFLKTVSWALPMLPRLTPAEKAIAIEGMLGHADIETQMISIAMNAAGHLRRQGVDPMQIGQISLIDLADDQLELVAMVETVMGALGVHDYEGLLIAWNKIRAGIDALPLQLGRQPGESVQ